MVVITMSIVFPSRDRWRLHSSPPPLLRLVPILLLLVLPATTQPPPQPPTTNPTTTPTTTTTASVEGVYEYRLVDPKKAWCCSTSGTSGVILAKGRKPSYDYAPNSYEHVSHAACLQLSRTRPPNPDSTNTGSATAAGRRHIAPYIVSYGSMDHQNTTSRSLEVEALQQFSQLAQFSENEKREDKVQFQTFIEYLDSCFQLHTDPVVGDFNFTTTPVFIVTNTAANMYATPTRPSCSAMPTSIAWYLEHFVTPKLPPNPLNNDAVKICLNNNNNNGGAGIRSSSTTVSSLLLLLAAAAAIAK